MPAALYDAFIANALGGVAIGTAPNVDWLSDTIRATLHNGYVPAKTTHDFVDDLTSEIAASGGYATGGTALANKTLAITSSVVKLDADDVVYAASTITADEVVVSDRTQGAATAQQLIYYHDNAAPVASTGGEWRAAWHANGIVSITVAAPA